MKRMSFKNMPKKSVDVNELLRYNDYVIEMETRKEVDKFIRDYLPVEAKDEMSLVEMLGILEKHKMFVETDLVNEEGEYYLHLTITKPGKTILLKKDV